MPQNKTIYHRLLEIWRKRGAVYAVLIDPDRKNADSIDERVQTANESGVDVIFVGGSLMMDGSYQERIERIKALSRLPVIFFPGGVSQLNPAFDAMLFLSIITGRNPHYLIGEQVIAAPLVKDIAIETIATGYMLIDGGTRTTVEVMSGTSPIPGDRIDVAVAHALAAQYLGMAMVYLEAGSGARNPVPLPMVDAVTKALDIPVIVGGGIKTPDVARERVVAGAGIIVTGTVFESQQDAHIMHEFSRAVHIKE
ncbi:MAG: geranylgeranylglyceryl/heptaprenylglyceryl phosphate synthase [Fidelibacterota bacterium]